MGVSPKIKITSQYLQILNVDESDDGNYACTIRNPFEIKTALATLTVQRKDSSKFFLRQRLVALCRSAPFQSSARYVSRGFERFVRRIAMSSARKSETKDHLVQIESVVRSNSFSPRHRFDAQIWRFDRRIECTSPTIVKLFASVNYVWKTPVSTRAARKIRSNASPQRRIFAFAIRVSSPSSSSN